MMRAPSCKSPQTIGSSTHASKTTWNMTNSFEHNGLISAEPWDAIPPCAPTAPSASPHTDSDPPKTPKDMPTRNHDPYDPLDPPLESPPIPSDRALPSDPRPYTPPLDESDDQPTKRHLSSTFQDLSFLSRLSGLRDGWPRGGFFEFIAKPWGSRPQTSDAKPFNGPFLDTLSGSIHPVSKCIGLWAAAYGMLHRLSRVILGSHSGSSRSERWENGPIGCTVGFEFPDSSPSLPEGRSP